MASIVVGATAGGADRPDRDRARRPYETTRGGDRQGQDVLLRQGVDADIIPGRDVSALADPGPRVVAHDPDVDAARHPNEATGDAAGQRERRDLVDRRHVDRLAAVRCALVRPTVHHHVVANRGVGVSADDRDADGTGDADGSATTGDRQPDHVFARRRLHDDSTDRAGGEPAPGRRSGVHAGQVCAHRTPIDHGVVADHRGRVLGERHHADTGADANRAADADAEGEHQNLAVVSGKHVHVVAGVEMGALADRCGGREVEHHYGHRTTDADGAAAREPGGDRDHGVACGGEHLDVASRFDHRVVADLSGGLDVDHPHVGAWGDPGRTADRERTSDTEMRELVGRRDPH